MNNGIYAKFTTPKGAILVSLEYEKTPGTVGNFVALAEGNLENSAKKQGEPYYDGLKFHRVIQDFMIQGGCPLGTGTGSPGYQFDDEFHPDLKHDAPGKLSMANAGPGTNGSQFFITHTETPWLDGKHTVFGNVIEGQDVVDSVSQGDEMSIEILRVGADAENFNAIEAFRTFEGSRAKREEEERKKQQELLDSVAAGMMKLIVVCDIKFYRMVRENKLQKVLQFQFTTKVNYWMVLFLIPLTKENNPSNFHLE